MTSHGDMTVKGQTRYPDTLRAQYLKSGWRYTLCPIKNATIFYNNFNNKCPITIIFGIVSIVSLGVIERWFHFPPHLSSATTLPWDILRMPQKH